MQSYTEPDVLPLKAADATASEMRRTAVEARFDRLLAEYGPALMRLAGAYTRTSSDRDDLFQEIGIAIWRALPKFREECSERTFLYRIAHNRAIAHLASKRAAVDIAGEKAQITDSAPGPERELQQKEERERLFGAVRRLPIRYRQVVTLTLEGLSYAEIAEVTGISEGNVGIRLNRARQILRESMESKR